MSAKISRSKFSTVAESMSYSLAILLFMLAGYLLRFAEKAHFDASATISATLSNAFGATTIGTLIFGSLLFLEYFVLRLFLLDRPPHMQAEVERIKLLSWAFSASVVAAAIVAVYVANFGWHRVPFICGAIPPGILLMRTVILQTSNPDSDIADSFVPKIFYPVFSVCFLAFLAGWGLFEPDYVTAIMYVTFLCVIAVIFSISITKIPTPKIAATFLLVVLIVAAIIQSFPGDQTYGRAMILAIFLTFAAGFGEVGKRPFLIAQRRVKSAAGEDENYYVSGANWSSILFLSLAPLAALYSSAPLIIGLAFACPMMIVAWHLVEDKTTRLGHTVALIVGFSVPFLVSLLALLSITLGWKIPGENADLVEGLAAVNGIFLTILFVLYPDDFKVLHANLYGKNTFLDVRTRAIFAALVVALQIVVVPLIIFVFELSGKMDSDTAQRASVILVVSLFTSIAIFVLLLLTPPGPVVSGTPDTPSKPDTPPTGGGLGTTVRSFAALLRPGSTALAGLCCMCFAVAVGTPDLATLTVLFTTGCLLGAYGFAINDLLDREKDRAGARVDKVLVSRKLTPYHVAGAAYALLLGLVLVTSGLEPRARIVALLLAGLLSVYSTFARRFPVLKGAYTAALCCLLPYVGVLQQQATVPHWMVLTIFTYVLGREILIDATELEADRAAKFATVAVVLGRRPAVLAAMLTMSAAAVLPAVFSSHGAVAASIVSVTMICLAATMALIAFDKQGWALQVTRLPMALLLLVLGAMSGG